MRSSAAPLVSWLSWATHQERFWWIKKRSGAGSVKTTNPTKVGCVELVKNVGGRFEKRLALGRRFYTNG